MGARKSNEKSKGRFIGIPYHVAISHEFAGLQAREVKLLIDLLIQFNGHNNGSLSPCHALMKKRGWSESSLHRAKSGLLEKGFIIVTKQGKKVRGHPTLIAITWLGINEPQNNKIIYDEGIKISGSPLSYWRNSTPKAA